MVVGKAFWSNIVTSRVQKSVTAGLRRRGDFLPRYGCLASRGDVLKLPRWKLVAEYCGRGNMGDLDRYEVT